FRSLQLRSHLGVHIIERSHCRRLLVEQPLQRRHVLIEQGLLLPVEQVGELLAQGCSPREQLAQLPHPSLSTSGAPAVTQDSRSIRWSAMGRLPGCWLPSAMPCLIRSTRALSTSGGSRRRSSIACSCWA